MRKSNRDVDIFGAAMLYLFASGVGAFIIISVILFPYHGATVNEELSAAKETLEENEKKIDLVSKQIRGIKQANAKLKSEVDGKLGIRAKLFKCGRERASCKVQLAKNFIIVQIEWQKKYDVNLFVRDPKGREYSWQKPNRGSQDYPESLSHLSIDFYGGPGTEVWLAPEAIAGNYIISAQLSRAPTETVGVKGFFFDRTGRKAFPKVELNPTTREVEIGKIRIRPDGSLEVN